jgi:digeranylgeranylglycerophospholipid reductase
VGIGIIHGDSHENPRDYLDKFVRNASAYEINLQGAQPLEYHFGLIPSDGLARNFVGDGILAVGDAAGQPSALLGEGIRWALRGGMLAAEVSAEALTKDDVSASSLARYEKEWRKRYGRNLRIAAAINRRIARWNDTQWDDALALLNNLNAQQFGEAIASNFLSSWVLGALVANPQLLRKSMGLARTAVMARGSTA